MFTEKLYKKQTLPENGLDRYKKMVRARMPKNENLQNSKYSKNAQLSIRLDSK